MIIFPLQIFCVFRVLVLIGTLNGNLDLVKKKQHLCNTVPKNGEVKIFKQISVLLHIVRLRTYAQIAKNVRRWPEQLDLHKKRRKYYANMMGVTRDWGRMQRKDGNILTDTLASSQNSRNAARFWSRQSWRTSYSKYWKLRANTRHDDGTMPTRSSRLNLKSNNFMLW